MSPLLAHRLRTLSVRKLVRIAMSLTARGIYASLFPFAYVAVQVYAKLNDKQYRFGIVNLSSIGGSLMLDAFLRRTRDHSKNIRYIFVLRYGPVINPYFYELMKRHVTVIETPLLRFFLTSLVRVPNPLCVTDLLDYIGPTEVGQYPPTNWFNKQDHMRGRTLLEKLGVTAPDAWYVCFFARDNSYNETYNTGDERNYNLTYHSSRNSDIDTYEDAIKFVLEQGGYVIRMGMVVSKPVGFKHPRLIDYPFSEFRSDFADVYLMCHGKFVIGCGSGIVDLSSIVDMPLGCVNNYLFWLGYERENMIFIPKMIQSTVTGKYLSTASYQRLFAKGTGADNIIVHIGIMKKNKLRYVNNSPADILFITTAMHQKFIKTRDGCDRHLGREGQIWPEFFVQRPELLSNEAFVAPTDTPN